MQDSSAFQYIAIDQIHESTTNPRQTRKKCIQNARNKAEQANASILASHSTNVKEGAIVGLFGGIVANCVTGAAVGAVIPIVTGFEPLAPVTGFAGCAANAFNPAGLIAGTATGIMGAYGLDMYHINANNKEDENTINNICSQLPD